MSDPGIEAIGQVAIAVRDLDRAVAFYEQVLWLRLLFRFPGLAFFDCGGVRLMMSKPEKPEFDQSRSCTIGCQTSRRPPRPSPPPA